MIKVRSLREALDYIKSLDEDTAISGNAIRMLVLSGKVPSVKVGKKYLVDVDMILKYFGERLSAVEVKSNPDLSKTNNIEDEIRPIPEQLKRRIV